MPWAKLAQPAYTLGFLILTMGTPVTLLSIIC